MTSVPRLLQPSRRSAVAPFQVMDILDRVAVLRSQGRDVVSLCAGEPSGGAPSLVSAAAAELHASGAAQLAAFAMEHDATVHSNDDDFGRFAEIRFGGSTR